MRFDLSIAEAGVFTLAVTAKDDAFPTVSFPVDLPAGDQQIEMVVPVPRPQLWSPVRPFLYDFVAELQAADGAADR